MPLVSSSIANLVNGVSQQPYMLRLASQAEVQENGLSTVAQGLKKRPPTKFVKRISNPVTGAYVHAINRDKIERYIVVVTNGDLKVYDMAGVEKTVAFPQGKAYLTSTDPAKGFRAITVADYTFLVNRDIAVTTSGANSPARPFEAIVVVKNGLYGKTYKVDINGSTIASYTAPNGTTASDAPQIATDYIANNLTTQLNGTAGLTATINGSTIYITKATDFTIGTSDGYSDAAMYAIKRQLQRFSDLPPNAYTQDFTVEVVGDKTSAFDNYWVKFDKSNNGTGVWRESIKPGISTGVAATTMPWALVRESNGTFTFKTLAWSARTVGDDVSAPQPSFVGRKIQDIFFYRNRLGFIADESVIFSEAGEFFNFYPTTVTDLLDSDRIDVSVSHTKVSNLVAAVPFSKQLLLFSAQTQFAVESGELLTPRTISIKPTTEFECDPDVHPEGIGKVVYFAVPKGAYSGIREYFVETDSGNNDAAEVTSHVPQYIPKNISKLTVALNEDILCAISPEEPNAIYVYKFYWNNNEKLQSSWSKWVFYASDNVLSIDFLESTLAIIVQRDSGLYLETLDVSETMNSDAPDYDPDYLVHLDRRVTLLSETEAPGTFTWADPYTVINLTTLGYEPSEGSYMAVASMGSGFEIGTFYDVIWSGGQAKILGKLDNYTRLTIGRKYAFRYRFSTIVPKQKTRTGGEQSDSAARLQLRKLSVNHAESGYFQAKVTPLGRPTYIYTYTGKNLGLGSSTIGLNGLAKFEDGAFSFPIMSRNTTVSIELYSDLPLPCSFLSADWEGYYAKRSQGI